MGIFNWLFRKKPKTKQGVNKKDINEGKNHAFKLLKVMRSGNDKNFTKLMAAIFRGKHSADFYRGFLLQIREKINSIRFRGKIIPQRIKNLRDTLHLLKISGLETEIGETLKLLVVTEKMKQPKGKKHGAKI